MKLIINQSEEVLEDEIVINCACMDERLQKLAGYIRQFAFSIEGELDGKVYHIPTEDILYIDSVDGKTFLYDSNNAYLCKKSLIFMEEKLQHTTFVRISKSCLLNVSHIKCVEPYINHRMKMELKNGEQLIVSRNYIESLKEKIRKGVVIYE